MTAPPHPLLAVLSMDAGDPNPAVEQVLDAALEQFVDVGIRRSTIEDIARRAGIDRVTVYRRVGSKDDLVQAVIAREARGLIDQIASASVSAGLANFEDRVAAGFAAAIQHVRANALYHRMISLEAGSVLPGMTTNAGPLLTIGVAAASGLIQQAEADGLIPPVRDRQAAAELLVRIVHSFVLTPQTALPLQTDAELRAFARSHLAPIVTRASAGPA
jgi:AcrR family transcriptional regulator